jgi:2'-5' RNA ligase
MARLRTFIAIDLPSNIRNRVSTLQETLARSAPDVKWVEDENLHLTLLFLGEVGDRDVLEVCRTTSKRCQSVAPFTLTVEGAGCFGNPRRPRTVWVGVGEGAAEVIALHDTIEEGLLDLGCYRREERQFTPHITLGRVKQDEGGDLAAMLQQKADWQAGTVEVREVLVMSSQLTPKGPVYAVLSRAPLQGSPPRPAPRL